jgi:hypothetical protein
MKRSIHKILAVALAAAMALSLLPMLPITGFEAAAAGVGSESVFDLLGIDTSARPDGYVEGDDVNPYGRGKINVNPVRELYIEATNAEDERGGTLYGDGTNPTGANFYTNEQILEFPDVDGAGYDVAQAAVGDFTNSGLKDKAVVVGANVSGGLFLYFTDPVAGTTSAVKPLISANTKLYNEKEADTWFDEDAADFTTTGEFSDAVTIDLYSPQALNNYLGVVTGDFTGDGIDEIAVYVPDPANPRVDIYQLQLPQSGGDWGDPTNWQCIYAYALERYRTGEEYFVPNMVSMAAGDIDFDGIDDLAVSAGALTVEPNSIWVSLKAAAGYYKEAEVNVLFGAKDGSPLSRKAPVASGMAPYGGLTHGDVDRNGRDELVHCGITFENGDPN